MVDDKNLLTLGDLKKIAEEHSLSDDAIIVHMGPDGTFISKKNLIEVGELTFDVFGNDNHDFQPLLEKNPGKRSEEQKAINRNMNAIAV